MNRNRWLLMLALVALLGCRSNPVRDLPLELVLNGEWAFKNVTDTSWLPAKVPGEVLRDLHRNHQVPDPFVGSNESQLQWIAGESWEYRTTFDLDEAMLDRKHLELEFGGLDTYADVFLNDSLILRTDNAFRTYVTDAKPFLQERNQLRIVFQSPENVGAMEKAKLNYELPGGDRVFTRKPQFQFGWDWGPDLTTCGVTKPITLRAWNDFRIDDLHLKTIHLSDSAAHIDAVFEVRSVLNGTIEVASFVDGQPVASAMVSADSGTFSVPVYIPHPKRWWPHNLGEPYRYDLKFVVRQGNTILDTIRLKKGLRSIELVTEKDSIGESFYFKVNGLPVYAKGANYVPQSSFPSEVSDASYEKLLSDAVAANMNMLRVWGGGKYEEDLFYELCDEKGILVWQDFMYACAMYPGDPAFLENVQQEAIDNVKRLRNHACIALWCGNNENSEGWHRWGWQDGRSRDETDEIWNGYLRLFDTLLPTVVGQYHPEADYWESSPRYGRGDSLYKSQGDAHDWWVWHDGYVFEHLANVVPRFMSEFGFQSFPGYATIRYINGGDSLAISGASIANHQKHPRGFALIREYMARDYPVPEDPGDYVYVSQLLQARGVTMGIEAQRRARPHCMGSLYWQLNDCWPAVSWSSIDFSGQWKALHYRLRQSYADVLVSSRQEGKLLKTWVVNDLLQERKGRLSIRIIDFQGKLLHEVSREITAPAGSSQLQSEIDFEKLHLDPAAVVVVATFDGLRSLHYLARPKDLKLHSAQLETRISKTDEGFSIELTSDALQKDVFLSSPAEGFFSDNFFDLLPNEKRVIRFETQASSLQNLEVRTLNGLIGK